MPAQPIVVKRGHAGGSQAQRKAVHASLVPYFSPGAGLVVAGCAALAVAAIKVAQARCVVQGTQAVGKHRRLGRTGLVAGAHGCPIVAQAHGQGQHRGDKHGPENTHEHLVRKQRIEIARFHGLPQAAVQGQAGQQKATDGCAQGQRDDQSVALVQLRQRCRPGIGLVSAHTQRGHGSWHVDSKVIGRRVLAGVQAGAALVA